MIRKLLVTYWLLLTILLFIGITALSLVPLPELPPVPGKDKTLHLIAYGVLAFPVSFARPKGFVVFLLLFVSWSGLIEYLQPMVNRSSDWRDLVANCLGILIGFLLAQALRIIWRT